MPLRDAGSINPSLPEQLQQLPRALRPGAVMGLAVAGVVGIAGLVQWDRRLMLIGLIAGVAILLLNVVIVVTRYWHARNTDPSVTYPGAEHAVRLRSPKSR